MSIHRENYRWKITKIISCKFGSIYRLKRVRWVLDHRDTVLERARANQLQLFHAKPEAGTRVQPRKGYETRLPGLEENPIVAHDTRAVVVRACGKPHLRQSSFWLFIYIPDFVILITIIGSHRLSESRLHSYADLARRVKLFGSGADSPGPSPGSDEPVQRDSATSAGEDEPHDDCHSRGPGSSQGRTMLRRRRQFDAQGKPQEIQFSFHRMCLKFWTVNELNWKNEPFFCGIPSNGEKIKLYRTKIGFFHF